jgi:hypothetical protein
MIAHTQDSLRSDKYYILGKGEEKISDLDARFQCNVDTEQVFRIMENRGVIYTMTVSELLDAVDAMGADGALRGPGSEEDGRRRCFNHSEVS